VQARKARFVALVCGHLGSDANSLMLTAAERRTCRRSLRHLPDAALNDLADCRMADVAVLYVFCALEGSDAPELGGPGVDLPGLSGRIVAYYYRQLPDDLPRRLRGHLAEWLALRDDQFLRAAWARVRPAGVAAVAHFLRTDPDDVMGRAVRLGLVPDPGM
jgi:hypothetical protein